MDRDIHVTNDGSKTLYIKSLNENYHSHHGALQEAEHVFIENGIKLIYHSEINILEMGFGTGLNVLVTINEFLKSPSIQKINYFSLEKYPVTLDEIKQLEYESLFDEPSFKEINHQIHTTPWSEAVEIVPGFFLTKIQCDFFELKNTGISEIDLVYYDCFGARVQPDLWEKPLFESVAETMKTGGLLTTYSSKGSVRRILQELDFEVEKKPGAPGKREMINAWKK